MVSRSKAQTQKFAIRLAKTLLLERSPVPHCGIRAKKILKAQSSKLKAQIIALQGELGTGKTAFVQGFMRGLGIKHHITSPTFIIYRKHQIPKSKLQIITNYQLPITNFYVYHFDLYRIHKPKEILALGFKKIIHDPHNIVLIEWPEKIKKILPKNTIWIYFGHGKKENERIIKIIEN